ncbi:MAG: hypothetical protein KDJ65_30225, partial [Anaerolineae bacterium]|nr:hypothetical protein [Anaerolineae bacterium]
IPDIRLSRVADFPQSIRIWSAVGQPFTGKWIIKAPNGQFLSLGESSLTTETSRSNNALFNFHYNLHYGQPQLIPGSDQESTFVNVAPGADPAYLFVDDSEGHKDAFSLTNTANDQWLQLSNDKTFRWTTNREDRAVFMRVVKIADNEGQVGELSPGEVALYEHYAYWGRTWILSDTGNDVAGNYTNFIDFQDLNDRISSIRLGPDTGVTLFKHVNYHVTNGNRENEIEDIVENVPSLQESQVGNDAISSVKIFKTVEPEGVLDSYTSKLSQDYRTTDNGLEEFSAYRTILKFSPDVGEVEVSATDLTQIEVEGIPYEIDEVRSVTLTPNAINRIMITSEADGLNTPGLKIRTSTMAANERVVIFPNKEAHQQIAELEGDALWNAKDAKGNLIVDRQAHSREEVASVQSTIKRTMATVAYAADAPVGRSRARSSVPSVDRVIDSRTIDNPWRLQFKAATGSNGSKRTVPGKGRIREEAISQDDLMQLLNQANRNGLGRARRGLISKIKDAVKKAVSVVVGVVKNVVHIIVETAKEVINFVIDTAEKVGEFVEAVVEKVVNGIKQFIEFLQFLFNWDDILETQRYLVRAFNSGLDSATQLAEAAKPRVSAFVDNLQDSVEDGLNVLVEKLGGEPSEVRTSGFELPEAFEWFLSKLLGGSQQEGANVSPRSSGNSEIDTFFSHFIEAFEDAVGAGLRVSEGLIESIQALIANPRQPELALVALIEALRDAIIQSLDAVENVALGLLDVISRVIQLVRNVLNAEIRIPFISDLFALIGAGKLTILNVSSLLLAIPVTLISKLVTNRKPFTAAALPFDVSSRGRLALAQSTEEQTDSPETISDLRRNLLYTTIGATADTVNHIINGVLDFADKPKPGPDSSAASVSSSASATKALPKFSKLFEWTSVFLSGLSLVVSKPSDLDADFDVISKEEKREIILWNVRATALGVDLAGVLAGEQRLRRLNAFTSIGWAIYNVADLVLFSMYLAAVEEDNQAIKNSTIISEVFSWLPNFVCIVRGLPLGEPLGTIAHVGHAVTNGAAAVATLATGIVLIIQDNKALEAALDAAKVTA